MELLLLGVLAVLIFGPAKLPEIGRSIGRATRDFKDAVSGTGFGDAMDGVNDVRSAMTPTNLAKAAMPASVRQVHSDVTEMKQTISDPLGQKQADDGEKPASSGAAAPPAQTPSAPPA